MISNTVAYRDPANGSMSICQGQVYMPHKRPWAKFRVPFLFNRCLHDQFRKASCNLQQLKLWMLFTRQTSTAYDEWEWKIDHWLIKSTQYSLPSPRRQSTIGCQPGKLLSLRSYQSLFQKMEHNVSAIQKTLIKWLIMHAQMYFIVSTLIFVLPR